MVILAALLIFATIKEPCDAVTSRVQINPFHHKEPIMALYQTEPSFQQQVQKKDGSYRLATLAKFRCDFCESIVVRETANSRKVMSCGCAKAGLCRDSSTRHGKSRSSVHNTWTSMLSRCQNKNSDDYPKYGGRGIVVCERWQTFESFLADMGEPAKGLTLDRIDVNGNYCKENCRWVDQKTQQRNRRNNNWITIEGVTKLLVEWAELNKISPSTIRNRLRDGWSEKDAVTKPARKLNRQIAEAW